MSVGWQAAKFVAKGQNRGAANFRYSGTVQAPSTPILLCINYEITQKVNKSKPPFSLMPCWQTRPLSRPASTKDPQTVMTTLLPLK